MQCKYTCTHFIHIKYVYIYMYVMNVRRRLNRQPNNMCHITQSDNAWYIVVVMFD